MCQHVDMHYRIIDVDNYETDMSETDMSETDMGETDKSDLKIGNWIRLIF